MTLKRKSKHIRHVQHVRMSAIISYMSHTLQICFEHYNVFLSIVQLLCAVHHVPVCDHFLVTVRSPLKCDLYITNLHEQNLTNSICFFLFMIVCLRISTHLLYKHVPLLILLYLMRYRILNLPIVVQLYTVFPMCRRVTI